MVQKHLIVDSCVPVFTVQVPNHITDLATNGAREIIDQNFTADDQEFDLLVANKNVLGQNIYTDVSFVSNSKCDKINNNISIVCRYIEHLCQDIALDYYNIKVTFKVVNSSILKYKKGNTISYHCHFPYTFVAALYIDIGENSSPIVVGDNYSIMPSKGKCIIMPGQCNHLIPETNGDRLLLTTDIISLV